MSGATVAKPLPRIDEDSRAYFQAASQGHLVIQRCRVCGHHTFYPRSACPTCLADELDWVETSGKGELFSYCFVHRPHHPAFYGEVPITFAAVRLAEGPVMLTELRVPDTTQIRIGMKLAVEFVPISKDLKLPVWRPASSA